MRTLAPIVFGLLLAMPPAVAAATDGGTIAAVASGIASRKALPGGMRRDCSGFVTHVYASAGRPLRVPAKHQVAPNVSAQLHAWAKNEGVAFRDRRPEAGDLAFFRDTYGKIANRVTHVGIVDRVERNGDVVVVHWMNGKVRRDKLSLAAPRDPKRNGYFRRKRAAGEPVLSGELFVGFARFSAGTPDGDMRVAHATPRGADPTCLPAMR